MYALPGDRLYRRIKLLSNKTRFRILQLTQHNALSITALSKRLQVSYTKTADYVAVLAAHGLVTKQRRGKEMLVRSNTALSENTIQFLPRYMK